MRTVNGTEVRVVGVLGSLCAGGVEHVMCEAHPGDKGRGFHVPVAIADIEGGMDAVRAALERKTYELPFKALEEVGVVRVGPAGRQAVASLDLPKEPAAKKQRSKRRKGDVDKLSGL